MKMKDKESSFQKMMNELTCTQTIDEELKQIKIKEKTNRIAELKEGIQKLQSQLKGKETEKDKMNEFAKRN